MIHPKMDSSVVTTLYLASAFLFSVVNSGEYCVDSYDYQYCSNGCCGDSGNQYCCYSTGEIVGIVFGVLVIIGIIVSIIACCICCHQSANRQRVTVGQIIRPGGNAVVVHSATQQQHTFVQPAQPLPPGYNTAYSNPAGPSMSYSNPVYPPPPAYSYNPPAGGNANPSPFAAAAQETK